MDCGIKGRSMEYSYYNISEDDLTDKLNTVKQMVLAELYNDGYLTDEHLVESLAEYYAVTIVNKKKFGSYVAKFFGVDSDSNKLAILRTSKSRPTTGGAKGTIGVECCPTGRQGL